MALQLIPPGVERMAKIKMKKVSKSPMITFRDRIVDYNMILFRERHSVVPVYAEKDLHLGCLPDALSISLRFFMTRAKRKDIMEQIPEVRTVKYSVVAAVRSKIIILRGTF
jgi:hypothetical protein